MGASVASLHEVRRYRPFIDGLRAVAILTVVGSHIGLPAFGGGYVGVDIFFVISGYLIINQIIEDIENGRFSILDFAMRRTFRILPAFLLVMVTCLVLSTTIFVQSESKDFAESFFLSAIMFANHHFLSHAGYFDMVAVTKPLLHMWSLAVEEQFYLLAPLTLLTMTSFTAKMKPERRQKTWAAMTLGLGVVSFAACVAFTFPSVRPNVSFYIMPTRGWEFILGGAIPGLALAIRRLPAFVNDYLAFIGAAGIALAVFFLDADTLYPSYWAAIPAVGAALVIAGGLVEPRNAVARLLATTPMVWIGLVSYPWYLWHWPLISFVRTINFGGHDIGAEVSAAALSLALAVLTYRFVELPARRLRQKRVFRPAVVVAAGTASCVVIASVGYLWALRVTPLMLPQLTGLDPPRIIGRDYPPISHRGVLIGDSHAMVIGQSFQEYAQRAGSTLVAIARAGCPPILDAAVKDGRGRVAPYCEVFSRHIDFQGAEFAIVSARWNFYLGLPQSDPFHRSFVLFDPQSGKDPYEIFAAGLTATIEDARRAGVQRILIIGPLPEFPWYSPTCVIRASRIGVDVCSILRAKVDARRERTMAVLRQAVARFDGVRLIDPINLFCTETECRPNKGTELFFFDTSHLSSAGAERLYQAYERDFLWALTGGDARNVLRKAASP
ncbi:MAG TPA: acyltransferase family protein [Pseudolabrys sp.]|nr:acyltransferase family protein [Pseudolabrys sp.]